MVVEFPSQDRYQKIQRNRRTAETNAVYTKAVYALFTRLEGWSSISEDPETAPSFRFAIYSYPPTIPEAHNQNRHDDLAYKYVEFDGLQELPAVSCVCEFSNSENHHPSTLAVLYKALPRLRLLCLELPPAAPRGLLAQRVGMRNSLASTLLESDFSTLERLDVHLEDYDPMNETWKPKNLLDSSGNDRLSLAVNRVSKLPRLESLELYGCFAFSPAVFDLPSNEDTNAWKSLEYLTLEVSMATPVGGWYFTGDHPLADIESDSDMETDPTDAITSDLVPAIDWDVLDGEKPEVRFRYHPDPTTFNPFITAMARAVVRMSALKEFICRFPQKAIIYYYGPGVIR